VAIACAAPRTRLAWRCAALLLALSAIATALGTVAVGRKPLWPIEVTGSPTPAEYARRSVDTVLDRGDFLTRAPDGQAHAAFRFSAPQSFLRIEHGYPAEPSPIHRLRRAAVQWSDGAAWHDAAVAESRDGTLVFDVSAAGAHARWRLLVLESGSASEVVIGRLEFVPLRSLPAQLLARVPVDIPWVALFLALLVLAASAARRPSPARIFAAAAVPAGLFVLAYSLGYAPLQPILTDDSWGYISALAHGVYSEFRNSGYPSFVLAVGKLAGFAALPAAQLLVQTVFYGLAVWRLSAAYGWRWLGPVLLLAFCLFDIGTFSAPWVMTEALFSAGLVLCSAGLAAAARRPSPVTLALAGLGLFTAVAAKSIGVILIVPAVLLLRFLPRRLWLRAATLAVLPGIGAYLLMSWHGYERTGRFSPEQFAGTALIGHVAWMLDGDVPGRPEIGPALRASVQPTLARRPADLGRIRSVSDLDDYVNYTANEYNSLLWENIAPAAWKSLGNDDYAKVDSIYRQLALSSIAKRPLAYAGHVAAHFYGLWREAVYVKSLRDTAVYNRALPAGLPEETRAGYRGLVGGLLQPYLDPQAARAAAKVQADVPLALGTLADLALDSVAAFVSRWRIGLVVGGMALLLSLLFLLPGRLSRAWRTEIMLALSINAYFLGHALFQPSLTRYGWVALAPAVLLTACVLSRLMGTLWRGIFACAGARLVHHLGAARTGAPARAILVGGLVASVGSSGANARQS
jgi:hypothetical protein